MAAPEAGVSANSAEAIDGIAHRIAQAATQASIEVEDFAYARYALKKANVPDQAMVAIVDPSVEFTLNTLSNLGQRVEQPRSKVSFRLVSQLVCVS
jgi:hypothetical protein